jgi:O-glycosyl hydrolase
MGMRKASVDFAAQLWPWDGLGINYVEASQTRNYRADPQDYGGFSLLGERDRQSILDMIFGDDGLKPGVAKMFLDPFHQEEPGPGYSTDPNRLDPAAYDHATTTHWMRYFIREGLSRTRARGNDLRVITTLYGPPAWMTKQRIVRGRDLSPEYRYELAKYMIAWTKYLRDSENIPVNYISLHNEGEDWQRWPEDGSTAGDEHHDYNLYWPPEQVVDFLRLMPGMLDTHGLQDVGITPGETSNWYRFDHYGYADAIARDSVALRHLGLITSHGFYSGRYGRWYGDHRSSGIDLLRAQRPDLHAWVTSTSWSEMDVMFVNEIRNGIYAAKVNAIIPWAAVQTSRWVGGDPNPGTAFRVQEDGTYSVEPGYYYYKQVCRAGQPGMAVATVRSNDPEIGLIAFASDETAHPDAFVLLNISDEAREVDIEVTGSNAGGYELFRTAPGENYVSLPHMAADGYLRYTAPPKSVTTFYAAR